MVSPACRRLRRTCDQLRGAIVVRFVTFDRPGIWPLSGVVLALRFCIEHNQARGL